MQIEHSLIQGCKNNDRASQVLLYRACYAPFMSICMRYKKNENESATLLNEGMLKVLDNLNKYNSEVPFEYWAKRIMINTAIDDYRRNKRHLDHYETTEQKDLENIDPRSDYNDAIQKLHTDELWQLINLLPQGRLQIFNMVAVDGFTYREVSERIGLNANTCKWHVAEARKFLQEKLKKKFMYSTIKNNETV